MKKLTVIILAAGKGTRMKSTRAKVLHEVFFRPMIHYVLDAVACLNPDKVIVIVGHQKEEVSTALQGYDVSTVEQKEQLGTGHAVLVAEDAVPGDTEDVMVLCGDTPLISQEALQGMYESHCTQNAGLTVMTTELENPFGYGRIITENGAVCAIVEQKDCTAEQAAIREINSGIYLVQRELLFEGLHQVTPDNSQGEFYLTDIVAYGVGRGEKVQTYCNAHSLEVLGVNSRVELAEADQALKLSRNRELMQQGVSILDSQTTTISPFAEVGKDTVIMSCVGVYGKSNIGEHCVLGHGAVIIDSVLQAGVNVGANTVVRGSKLSAEK